VLAKNGAHHYRLVGLEVLAKPGVYGGTTVEIGTGYETTESSLPSDIELDRVWVHAEAPSWGKRGVSMNGKRIVVQNSWISGYRSASQDTQAVAAWNTPGPLQVANNYLEASAMSLLIGGAEPSLVGVTPSDIEITGNLMSRPVEWKGQGVVIKNVLELKCGRRVNIRGNILENTWVAAQTGYAVVFILGTQINTPAVTSDVVFEDNLVRHAAGGFLIAGTNPYGGHLSSITIRNNLFDDIGTSAWGPATFLATLTKGTLGVVFENNTASPAVRTRGVIIADVAPSTGFVLRGNVLPYGNAAIFGSGIGDGGASLTKYFPGGVIANNVIYNALSGAASRYPTGNYFPLTSAEVGFTNAATGDYSLLSSSTYSGVGAAGRNPGVSWSELLAATARTATGQ
jgi:hypothetical protein